MTLETFTLPAPAKLNRFLHIVGRRTDGYHNLQTLFQLVDYHDTLSFRVRQDNQITLNTEVDKQAAVHGSPSIHRQDNLVFRAAKLFKSLLSVKKKGVDIELIKRIPLGAGLGGGSSDAATTLLALNQLWGVNLPLPALEKIGVQIGADVPVFIQGCTAWGEGIGDQLTPLSLPSTWFLVVIPPVTISSIEIFCDEWLTRDTPICKISPLLAEEGRNDCEATALRLYPEVGKVLSWLKTFGNAKMTGSGSGVFLTCETEAMAKQIALSLPESWKYFVTQGLNVSLAHLKLRELA